MIKLMLPFPPSVNRLWRASKGGKVHRSEEYRQWRTAALWQLKGRYKGEPVSIPYKLAIHAVRPDKRRRDIGNLEKAISDILQDAGVIKDDCLCEWIECRWVPSGPQCQIFIETMEEVNGRIENLLERASEGS